MKRKETLSSQVWPATALLQGHETPRGKRREDLLVSQPSQSMKSAPADGSRGTGL